MTRKPIGLSVPYREISAEDEAFNEIERRSKVKQTLIIESKRKALTDERIKEIFESYGQFVTGKELAMIRAIEELEKK